MLDFWNSGCTAPCWEKRLQPMWDDRIPLFCLVYRSHGECLVYEWVGSSWKIVAGLKFSATEIQRKKGGNIEGLFPGKGVPQIELQVQVPWRPVSFTSLTTLAYSIFMGAKVGIALSKTEDVWKSSGDAFEKVVALRDYTTLCLPVHSEILSIMALNDAEAFLKRNRQICEENYRILQAREALSPNLMLSNSLGIEFWCESKRKWGEGEYSISWKFFASICSHSICISLCHTSSNWRLHRTDLRKSSLLFRIFC